MKNKSFSFVVIGSTLALILSLYAINVMAYGDGESHTTQKEYKTDRSLIKQVIANQKKTHALLKEIKASL